jgi:hypothetical protein
MRWGCYVPREKIVVSHKNDATVPDERTPGPVKASCTGRVQRILQELMERSVTSEITLRLQK